MTFTFSLLILNSCLAMASCCQRDRNPDHRSRVNCTGMTLSDVPSDIDQATEVIVLTDNEFVSLSWTSYRQFHKLHELDLSRNRVSSLEKTPDLIVPSLNVLRLTGNRLQELPASAFMAVSNVMEIYLSANQLHTLNKDTFKDLKNLEVLDLSQNLIKVLPLPLLSVIATEKLKNFDVEDNRLKVMPDGFFSKLPDIPYVYLSKNPWVCNCNVGYLAGWLEDQGHNVYVHTGPSKFVNDPESVVCDSPSNLKFRVIMDLTEEEYCSTSPLGDMDSIEPPVPSTLPPTTIASILSTAYVLPTTQTTADTQTNTMNANQGITTTPTLIQTTTSTQTSTFTSIPTNSRTHTSIRTTSPTQTHITTTDTFSFLTEKMYSYYLTWTSWYESHETKFATSETATELGMEAEHTTISATFQITTIPPLTYTSTPSSTPPTTLPSTTANHPIMTDPPRATKQSPNNVDLESRKQKPVVYYCWWLFVGYLCLCVLLGLWLCMIFLWSVRAYLRVYLPLACKKKERRRHALRLPVCFDKQTEHTEGDGENARWIGMVGDRAGAISLPFEGAEGVQAMFRSVLFVDRTGESKEGEGEAIISGDKERAGGPATSPECIIIEGSGTVEIGGENGEVHRKTVFKLISREEEITGLRDKRVTQGWPESNRRSSEVKKRYSLILREERVEGDEQDRNTSRESSFWNEWVVGGWMLRDTGGEGAGRDTGEEDWWSLMPLIARGSDFESRGSSATANVITSETQL